jgi:uncharacterized protein with HEPN domain
MPPVTVRRSIAMSYSNPGFCGICRSSEKQPRGLPDAVRAQAPEIPWPQLIGMRNVLVHGYFDIDQDIVWDAVMRDVPALEPAVEQLLAHLESQT